MLASRLEDFLPFKNDYCFKVVRYQELPLKNKDTFADDTVGGKRYRS